MPFSTKGTSWYLLRSASIVFQDTAGDIRGPMPEARGGMGASLRFGATAQAGIAYFPHPGRMEATGVSRVIQRAENPAVRARSIRCKVNGKSCCTYN